MPALLLDPWVVGAILGAAAITAAGIGSYETGQAAGNGIGTAATIIGIGTAVGIIIWSINRK